jgi:hypothetical protein
MTSILEPNDPTLGSTYEDGVERARRVNLKKKKKPGDVVGEPSTGLEDIGLLQEAGALPKGTDPSQLAATQLSDGWTGYQDWSQAGALYYTPPGEVDRLRKRKGQSTILGG